MPINRAMIDAAERVTLLADVEKFSMGGLVRVCEADAIDEIITDGPLLDACGPAVADGGIAVTIG
ncbi:MAG: hypothetical protein QOK49_3676 [Baekduia sp.]|nr:hypothetical protein [Baekduia sp.]